MDSAGKAFAGDWGLLKAELSEVGNPGIFWLCEAAVPPRFKEPIPDRGSIWSKPPESDMRADLLAQHPNSKDLTCTGEMASRLLVLGARPFGMTPGGGWRALFITLLQLATMVRMVSDSSWDTLLQQWGASSQTPALDWLILLRHGPGTPGTKQKPCQPKRGSLYLPPHQAQRVTHPAQDCRQASMVAKVSGGSWELLGWSLSGGRPPIIEGQRRFRKVTHAWMKGSFRGETLV